MAKKKKHSAQNQQPQGERVINQLFGSLEQEPDIESDIAELGGSSEAEQTEPVKQKKSRFFFGFAVFVIIMAVIGVISSVQFVANVTANLLDNTSLKNEFAAFIFPVVVNDIAPFEEADEIPDSSKISCAIWNILLNSDTSQFERDEGTGLSIPEYNVNASCRELFGSSVSLEHQTVGTAEVRFTYNEDTHTYTANKNIRYLTYSPQIVSIEEDGEVYTVVVGYLPPTVAAVAGISGLQAQPEKYMEYTISRWDGKDTLMSVRFSDYQPETSEVAE
ncbi:MAG: hypothetical protein J6A19_01335 [Oscillospiraceae bacterium]|nr:hypothetical protein [Oscillospiraceae bacterium]